MCAGGPKDLGFYGVRVRPQDDLDYSYLVVAYHTLQNATVPVVGSDGAMSPPTPYTVETRPEILTIRILRASRHQYPS